MILRTKSAPHSMPEVIDIDQEIDDVQGSVVHVPPLHLSPTPIAQSPIMSEPVTGTRNVGESVVNVLQPTAPPLLFSQTTPIAQSPELSEPVTGMFNLGESVVDVPQPIESPFQMSPTSPIVKSSALNEPVTGLCNNGESGVDDENIEVPFKVRIDDVDTSIVDYDDSDLETPTVPLANSTSRDNCFDHAERIVRAWNDYEIPGLKIMRGTANLPEALGNVTRHFFYENNKPKPGLYWTDLFSNKVFANIHRNDNTGEIISYYENSTRATVPLFDWVRGRTTGDPKFANHVLSDEALSDIQVLQQFVLSNIMPQLGFNSSLVRFEISGMSILLQPPVGGISQVMHTDDYPESVPGEWISLLFPCHQQRGTVFLRKLLSDAFGTALGVKPFFNIGDVAAWCTVKHFGSGAEAVEPHMLLRSALFVFVHVTPLSQRISETIVPVTGAIEEGNRDENDQEIIHYGPDEIHWTGGLVPIIRVCVCCLNGVNCDYEAQLPSQQQCLGPHPTTLLFCTQCAESQCVPDNQARVRALVCKWCKDNDSFSAVGTCPDMDTSTDPYCVVSCLYESVINANLCTHGKKSFLPLPIADLVFVLFSHDEIASSCQFWMDFYMTYHFTEVYCPIEFSQDPRYWPVFWEIFMTNSLCTRARMLCWIGAIIAGIGPVMSKKDKLYHGGYPVFYHSKVCSCGRLLDE